MVYCLFQTVEIPSSQWMNVQTNDVLGIHIERNTQMLVWYEQNIRSPYPSVDNVTASMSFYDARHMFDDQMPVGIKDTLLPDTLDNKRAPSIKTHVRQFLIGKLLKDIILIQNIIALQHIYTERGWKKKQEERV